MTSASQQFPATTDGDSYGFSLPCAPGTVVLSGGASVTASAGSPIVAIRESRPGQSSSTGPYDTWSASGVVTKASTPGSFILSIWVICSPGGP